MPTLKKIAPDQAADWDLDFAPFVLEAMLDRIAGDDRGSPEHRRRVGPDADRPRWR
jgi:hypothetical protein